MHQNRLPGDAGRPQEVSARCGAAAAHVPSGRHARLSLRGGGGAEGAVPRAKHGGGADPGEGALAQGGGPCGPLPGRREPAADGLSGDREDAPGQEDRGGASGARGHGAHHHQDPCGRAECGAGGADGGPLGAAQRPQRALQRHLAGHRRAHSVRHSPLGGHSLLEHEQEDSLSAARGLPAAARRLG